MQTKYTVQCKKKGTNIKINPDVIIAVFCLFCVGLTPFCASVIVCFIYCIYVKKSPEARKDPLVSSGFHVCPLLGCGEVGLTQSALRWRTETIKDAHFFKVSMFFLHDKKKTCACVEETKEFVCVCMCFVFRVSARPCWLLCLCAAFLIASSVNVKRSNGTEPSRFIFSFVLDQMQAALLLLARRNYCYPAKCADE